MIFSVDGTHCRTICFHEFTAIKDAIVFNLMDSCTTENNLIDIVYNIGDASDAVCTANVMVMHDVNVLLLYTFTIYSHGIFNFNVFVLTVDSTRFISSCYIACSYFSTLIFHPQTDRLL